MNLWLAFAYIHEQVTDHGTCAVTMPSRTDAIFLSCRFLTAVDGMYTPFRLCQLHDYVIRKLSKKHPQSQVLILIFSLRSMCGPKTGWLSQWTPVGVVNRQLRPCCPSPRYQTTTSVWLRCYLCQELRHHLGHDVVIDSAHHRLRRLSISSLRPRKTLKDSLKPLRSMVAVQVGVDSTCRNWVTNCFVN